MRIRITRNRYGIIDGVNLATFHTGRVYEVDPSVGSYLVVTSSAEPVDASGPALVVSGDTSEMVVAMTPELKPDVAAEEDPIHHFGEDDTVIDFGQPL